MAQRQRTPEEIRTSIAANRMELAQSVAQLRGEVERISDWRGQIERHREEIVMGAAAVGVLLATRMLLRRRRRRRGR